MDITITPVSAGKPLADEAPQGRHECVRIQAVYEVTDKIVSGHALATRWEVRSSCCARSPAPSSAVWKGRGKRERYYLGRDER